MQDRDSIERENAAGALHWANPTARESRFMGAFLQTAGRNSNDYYALSTEPAKSGFFDLPIPYARPCHDIAHNPPTHLYVPPGKGYRHVCPSCGHTLVLFSPDVICGVASVPSGTLNALAHQV